MRFYILDKIKFNNTTYSENKSDVSSNYFSNIKNQKTLINAEKINFMLDNVKIEGYDEENRAIHLVFRPMRSFNIPEIKSETPHDIFMEILDYLPKVYINNNLNARKLVDIQITFPAYDKEEINTAVLLYDDIMKLYESEINEML